jgi:hypothetical protein
MWMDINIKPKQGTVFWVDMSWASPQITMMRVLQLGATSGQQIGYPSQC